MSLTTIERPLLSASDTIPESASLSEVSVLTAARVKREAQRYPVDELTGQPLVVLTVGTQGKLPQGEVTNNHHLHFDRKHPDLEGGLRLDGKAVDMRRLQWLSLTKLAGLAVRVSRTQRLDPTAHDWTHNRYPVGPILPHTNREKFTMVANNCAGVVPRVAVDVTARRGKELVYMDDEQFAVVADPSQLHTEDYCYERPDGYQSQVLGLFFLHYSLREGLKHVSKPMINDFLHATHPEQHREIGDNILQLTMASVVAPLLPAYDDFRRGGMVRDDSKNLSQIVWGYAPPELIEPVLDNLQTQLVA